MPPPLQLPGPQAWQLQEQPAGQSAQMPPPPRQPAAQLQLLEQEQPAVQPQQMPPPVQLAAQSQSLQQEQPAVQPVWQQLAVALPTQPQQQLGSNARATKKRSVAALGVYRATGSTQRTSRRRLGVPMETAAPPPQGMVGASEADQGVLAVDGPAVEVELPPDWSLEKLRVLEDWNGDLTDLLTGQAVRRMVLHVGVRDASESSEQDRWLLDTVVELVGEQRKQQRHSDASS